MVRLFIALKTFIFLFLLTGVIYPLLLLTLGGLLFPFKSNGQILTKGEKKIGSVLIGQEFKGDRYFKGRPSAALYDPMKSSGSNLSLTSKKLQSDVEKRKKLWGENAPKDLLFASGSGLDPHISKEAAYYQIEKIAKSRQMEPKALQDLVKRHVEQKSLGFIGTERVNVLLLNLALDGFDVD